MGQPDGPGPGATPASVTTAVATGQVTGQSGVSIGMTPSEVRITGGDVQESAEHMTAARTDLGGARGGGGDFTSFPAAQAVFTQHQAVLDVFDQTLGLMHEDVQNFGASIVQAARTYEQTDEDALVCMRSISSGVDPTTLDSRDQQVRQSAAALQDVTLSAEEQVRVDAMSDVSSSIPSPGGPHGAQ